MNNRGTNTQIQNGAGKHKLDNKFNNDDNKTISQSFATERFTLKGALELKHIKPLTDLC